MEFNLIYRALHREMASNFALSGGQDYVAMQQPSGTNHSKCSRFASQHFIYSFAPHYHQYVQKGTPNIIIY